MLSSHLMSETALIADHLVIIGRGRLLADTTVDDFIRDAGGGGVKVATTEAERLRSLLAGPDVTISSSAAEELIVAGRDAREIGAIAAQHGVPLYELTPQAVSLEEAFMELTQRRRRVPQRSRRARAKGRLMTATDLPVVRRPHQSATR